MVIYFPPPTTHIYNFVWKRSIHFQAASPTNRRDKNKTQNIKKIANSRQKRSKTLGQITSIG